MPRQSKDTVAVLGGDIGKNTFHLVGLNERGAIILHRKLVAPATRSQARQPTALPGRRPVSAPTT
jgi:transposase